jgi:hypothetical protein
MVPTLLGAPSSRLAGTAGISSLIPGAVLNRRGYLTPADRILGMAD